MRGRSRRRVGCGRLGPCWHWGRRRLDGRWVAKVTAADIIERSGTVLVRVGEPASRVVPVLPDWQDEVVDLAETAGCEVLVSGTSASRNRAGALAA
jgi:hypothetical protein